MKTIIKLLSSRTNITVIIMGLISVTQQLEPVISQDVYVLITTILGALAIYFRSNPRVDFTE